MVSLFVASLALVLGCTQSASQSVHASTAEPATLTPERYLRQLALDLTGAPPSDAMTDEVLAQGAVSDAQVEALLRSEGFLQRVRRWHQELLWPTFGTAVLRAGVGLVLVQPGGQQRPGFTNPERVLEVLDRRTDGGSCPAAGSEAHLTEASCCTAEDPGHPACCLVRNRTYNPDDPACLAKARALPAIFAPGPTAGDRTVRGGDGSLGCNDRVEYPPPRVPMDDARFLHDTDGRPYYLSARSGQRRYYYDDRGVPLPYDDAVSCPGYCRALVGSGPAGAFTARDFVARTRVVGGVALPGDHPEARCPEGFAEVANRCDNGVDDRPSRAVEHRREGYRLQRTWWSRGHWVKVCAYDAQERTRSLHNGEPCRPGRYTENTCGCGPEGRACTPSTGVLTEPSGTERRLRESLADEPLQLIADVVARGEDYSTVFVTRRSLADGPLTYLYREQAEVFETLLLNAPAAPEELPRATSWEDETWRPYLRAEHHSGVLTMPVYLARFPTRRARVNRFRTAFLCRPFEADGPTPAADDGCHREPDLSRRCGCQRCHAALEPLGAFFGRWAENGLNHLSAREYPAFDPACATCVAGVSCASRCTYYVTDPASPQRGMFEPLQYRTAAETANLDQGPAALVADAVAAGALQRCTVETLWRQLLRRPPSENERRRTLPDLVARFEASGRNYRSLVRAVVTSPAYRRLD
ncbi:MAG: hypothetical protein HY909_23280 [Deltaproteobacteria bacterium]|nr:hypothetical protein [Deltaproteobacteria bacterium]